MSGMWVAIGSAVVGAYSSYASSKAQKDAAAKASQSRTTTSSPYMADRINPIIPYLMSEEQKIYESRMKTYGGQAGDFSPIAAQLSGIPSGYNGLGTSMPSGPSPAMQQYGTEHPLGGYQPQPSGSDIQPQPIPGSGQSQQNSDELLRKFQERRAARQSGQDMTINDLINYWDTGR